MLVLREKINHISIWIFIINVMKGVSLSTPLIVIFHMKHWISPTSCSFQLTHPPIGQMYIATGFVTLVDSYIEVTATLIDYILFVRALGLSTWKRSWLKCFNLNILLFLIQTNFMKKIKKHC